MHTLKKLKSTLRIVTNLFCARMFGEYEHSGYDGTIEYARYTWRGKSWVIPTGYVS